MKTSGSIIS